MQSKMTEREFRERFDSFGERSHTTLADDAVDAAREAGLEFAPEPVKLPERLWQDDNINTRFDRDGRKWYWIELPAPERKAVQAAMIDRYNAYPGLREAASQVLERAQNLVAKTYAGTVATPPWLRLRDSLAFLEDELAKEPK